jgi:hypothetical protein
MQQTAELGNELVSVDRVLEYSQLEPEESEKVKVKGRYSNSNLGWRPVAGIIEFKNVDATYSGGSWALKNVNCLIQRETKVRIYVKENS